MSLHIVRRGVSDAPISKLILSRTLVHLNLLLTNEGTAMSRFTLLLVWLLAASVLHAFEPPGQSTQKKLEYSPALVAEVLASARQHGDARRGAVVFSDARFACISCHKIGKQGGTVGPDLTQVGTCITPEALVESVLWPAREVKKGYNTVVIASSDGKILKGYIDEETATEVMLRDPATNVVSKIAKANIEDRKDAGTLMPDGIAEAMTPEQRRDLIRFLLECGKTGVSAESMLSHTHSVASFTFNRDPLHPEQWPNWQHPVNRDRVYDFYTKEAEHFSHNPGMLLPAYPGLDGGKYGHWGNQDEKTWANDHWSKSDLGFLQSCIFKSGALVIPRALCVRLGDYAACFNPSTLRYEAFWNGGFLKISSTRSGFIDPMIPDGQMLPLPDQKKPDGDFRYQGLYRTGSQVTFAYTIDGVAYLDTPSVKDGKLIRTVTQGNKPTGFQPVAQWPEPLITRGKLGTQSPYAVDTIVPPFENPWKAMMSFGGHDFMPDGSAMICTMQGDVWHVSGLNDKLESVTWRRFASGLNQALGLVVADGKVYVIGRDQITRLHDTNNDGEADYYERFSAACVSSPAGHDYICGLERDHQGRFYTASGNEGVVRISADGKTSEVLATGLRNPDGLGLLPDGTVTVPSSEGNWVPASMIGAVPGNARSTYYFGYGGPLPQRPQAPLVYLPRGLDNSSGGQVAVTSDKWGPMKDQLIHFSFGTGTHFLVLRDGEQGAAIPLPGDFLSGVHRGRFSPRDGQLYVSGMGGWGTYTPHEGCFQRVRYTGDKVQLPKSFRAVQNGVLISFTSPIQPALVANLDNHFVQAWNYRYSSGYGSQEFSPSHYGAKGHDRLTVKGAHVVDTHTIFLEIPDLQPVNQLHLHSKVDAGPALDLYATVHTLGQPFTQFPGYTPVQKTIAAHPLDVDLAMMVKLTPNPYSKSIKDARAIQIDAGQNLSYVQRTITVKAGEAIKLTFNNPDVVPHNLVLVKPGTLERVGQEANRLVADPEAVTHHYVPKSNDVLVYTDIVQPDTNGTIYFKAPSAKGRYPYLCTFPGHWMVMNGVMIVE